MTPEQIAQRAEKRQNGFRTCSWCASRFEASARQRETRQATGRLYCGKPCLYASRSEHTRQHHRNGTIPPWGSARQRESAARNLRPDHYGVAHGMWRGGGSSNAMREAQKLRRAINQILSEKEPAQ